MKNVAATNGQSVSLAALFLAVEITWEGIWAGTDMLLNFYSRPPRRRLFSTMRWEQTRSGRIQGLQLRATKKCIFLHISSSNFACRGGFTPPAFSWFCL